MPKLRCGQTIPPVLTVCHARVLTEHASAFKVAGWRLMQKQGCLKRASLFIACLCMSLAQVIAAASLGATGPSDTFLFNELDKPAWSLPALTKEERLQRIEQFIKPYSFTLYRSK